MDYYQIGQAIRKYRRAGGLSQDELAERVGISTTHMSHIETGNTKLSLPVLAALAQELGVQTDSILFAQPAQKSQTLAELQELADTCSPQQLAIILETARAVKAALERHMQE